MNPYNAQIRDLRFLLDSDITAKHIAQFELTCCAPEDDAQASGRIMAENQFDVLPVRHGSTITGYIKATDVGPGRCRDYERPLFPGEITSAGTPLIDILRSFMEEDRERIFVLEGSRVTGLIARADLQRSPVRIALFGLITLFEIRVLQAIREVYPDESWQSKLGPGRLRMAQDIQAERERRNQILELSDCLQIVDKGTIAAKTEVIKSQLELGGRDRVESFFGKLETVRNNLAHGNDVIGGTSWSEVLGTILKVESILERWQ